MTQLLKWISLTAGKGHPSGTNPLWAIRASKASRVLTRNVSKNSNLFKGVLMAPFFMLKFVQSERAY